MSKRCFKYIIEMTDGSYGSFGELLRAPKIINARRFFKPSLKENYFGLKMGNGPVMPTTQANFVLYAGSIDVTFPELM